MNQNTEMNGKHPQTRGGDTTKKKGRKGIEGVEGGYLPGGGGGVGEEDEEEGENEEDGQVTWIDQGQDASTDHDDLAGVTRRKLIGS